MFMTHYAKFCSFRSYDRLASLRPAYLSPEPMGNGKVRWRSREAIQTLGGFPNGDDTSVAVLALCAVESRLHGLWMFALTL